MLQQQRRADGVDGEAGGELAGREVRQALFRRRAIAVQAAGGGDDQMQRGADLGGGAGDAGLVGEVEIRAGEGERLGVGGGAQGGEQGGADAAAGADDQGSGGGLRGG